MTKAEIDAAVRTFWASTSIRGVPRAVHSQELVTRVCWGTASLACLCLLVGDTCIYCLQVVTRVLLTLSKLRIKLFKIG